MAQLHLVGDWHGPGEERTAKHLQSSLPDRWVIVASREIPNGTRTVEVDLIVVGERRVFVCEEKSWGKRVEIRETSWVVHGERRHNPYSQVQDATRVLAGRVERRVAGWTRAKRAMPRGHHLIRGHVLLSHPRLELIDRELPGEPLLGHDAVLTLADAPGRLLDLDSKEPSTLDAPLRDALLAYLLELPPGRPTEWPESLYQYTRLDTPVRQDQALVFPATNQAGQLFFLNCVPIEGDLHPDDARRIATREFSALEKLARSRRTWQVQGWFEWESFIITPVQVEMDGTSLHKLAQLSRTGTVDQLDFEPHAVVLDAFRALSEVHGHDISHRALSPRSVELDSDGRVRFRGFSRSRIVAEGTISSLLDSHESDAFAPSGQLLGYRDDLDDVYSLALSLVLWLRADPSDEPNHEACRDWAATRNDGIGRALSASLNLDRRHRPTAADVVKMVAEPRTQDRYEFIDRIGRGAMGDVWRARDRSLGGREVAIKCLPTESTIDEAQTDRFRREAQLLARLRHPHIIAILDWDIRDADLRLVMPLVEGATLRNELREKGTLDPRRVVEIAEQLGQALDFAHASGLVHRDVKPENVLLDANYRGDFAYLIDFGIASGGTLSLESGGAILGTPFYMAPERFGGESEDYRVDIYSMGCVLFELLTGSPPFAGDFRRVAAAHIHSSPPRPEGMPAAVSDALATALAKSPSNRFASASALAAALREAFEQKTRHVSAEPRTSAAPTWSRLRALKTSYPKAEPRSIGEPLDEGSWALQERRKSAEATVRASEADGHHGLGPQREPRTPKTPASPETGGTVLVIPLAALRHARTETLVWTMKPRLREEMLSALIGALPRSLRRNLVPATYSAQAIVERLDADRRPTDSEALLEVISETVERMFGVYVPDDAWNVSELVARLGLTFHVADANGPTISTGTDLAALRREHADQIISALAADVTTPERCGLTSFAQVGELPWTLQQTRASARVTVHLALVDEGIEFAARGTVGIGVFDSALEARDAMRNGTRRLLLLATSSPARSIIRSLDERTLQRLSSALEQSGYGGVADLANDCVVAAVDGLVSRYGGPARGPEAFETLREKVAGKLPAGAAELFTHAEAALYEANALQIDANSLKAREPGVGSVTPSISDIRSQQYELMYGRFVSRHGAFRLRDLTRWLRAARQRVEKLPSNLTRDVEMMHEVRALEALYRRRRRAARQEAYSFDRDLWETVAAMLQELRVSLYSQIAYGASRSVTEHQIVEAMDRLSG